MSKVSFALVAVGVVISAVLTPSLVVRAQGTTRVEYARVTPSTVVFTAVARDARRSTFSYRACVAAVNGWACRDFESRESPTEALRIAFVELANEGWELVSVVEEDKSFNASGLTYLFKRQRR